MKSNVRKEAICRKAEFRVIGDCLRVLKMEVEGQNYQGARPGDKENVRAPRCSLLTVFPPVWELCPPCNLSGCCGTDLECLFQLLCQLHWIKFMIIEPFYKAILYLRVLWNLLFPCYYLIPCIQNGSNIAPKGIEISSLGRGRKKILDIAQRIVWYAYGINISRESNYENVFLKIGRANNELKFLSTKGIYLLCREK